MGNLYGSVKSVNITPPVGMTLTGYMERDHGAEGIKDELYAKVLVLSDGNEKLALVTTDLSAVDYNVTKGIREIVERETGIKGQNVMVTASHTHSGPAACRMKSNYSWMNLSYSDADVAYYELLKEKIARAIVWANNDLKEVKIGLGEGNLLGLGANRRVLDGPYDSAVYVLRIDNKDGETIAAVVNYTCHPTVLSGENFLVSGDYPSYMMRTVAKVYEKCEAMFIQGAAGDVSTRHNRRGSTFEEADRMGRMLAGKVIELISKIEMKDNAELQAFNISVKIPVRDFPTEEACLERIERAQNDLERLISENAPVNIVRTAKVTLEGAERNLLIKRGLKVSEFDTEMQLFKIGNTVIVSVPGELFNEIGTEIKKINKDYNVIVAGYANDYIGYILTEEVFNSEGYETGVTMVKRESGKMIVDYARELISKIN